MKPKINLFGLCGIALALLIGLTGCGEDAVEEDPVEFVQAIPATGSEIQQDAMIIATFDGTPNGVNVTGGKFSVSGANVKITGPFTAGALNLTITWSDGAAALVYNVKAAGTETAGTGDTPAPPPDGMVLIPAGEFDMGSNDAEAGNDEQPVHKVYVDAFYMDTHEVTNLDFKRFVLANPQWQKTRIPKPLHDGNYLEHWDGSNNYPAGKANHPVVYVSWHAAMAYAKWAGKRLPTEAEWEKAARGGKSGLKYPWGNTIDPGRANYNNPGGTVVIGSYAANGYGLFDMVGNAAEWCLDAYDKDFYFSSPARNPLSDVNTIANLDLILNNHTSIRSLRVLRGGGWGSSSPYVRLTQRGHGTTAAPLSPSTAASYVGFRCVKDVTD